MPRKKKEEPAVENAAAVEAVETPTVQEAAPAKKTRKPRAKKEPAAVAENVKEAVKKTVTRRPRKKAVKTSFVIQNQADQSVTYDDIVAKVQAEIKAEDIASIDIYVKAEEGKAYYVVNGEAVGAVNLF